MDKPHNSERRANRVRHQPQDQFSGPADRKRSPEFTRWIEAKNGSTRQRGAIQHSSAV